MTGVRRETRNLITEKGFILGTDMIVGQNFSPENPRSGDKSHILHGKSRIIGLQR